MGHVAVLGAGAWGTALAKLLADQGEHVRLWSYTEDVVESIKEERENKRFLPSIKLPAGIEASSDFEYVLVGAEMVLIVVPSHSMRDVMKQMSKAIPAKVPLVSATKGIENDTLMLMNEVIADVLGPDVVNRTTALSGPSFAKEVALRHPTAVVIAGHDEKIVEYVQHRFSNEVFRAYSSLDMVGVELGGALKNVVAIAAGAADGLGFGYNTRAGLITRGLSEIARIAMVRGASPMTIAGLAGMGDLVLTCTGDLSRNRTVGFQLGQGKTLDQILKELGHVAEGVKTTQSAFALSTKLGVEMPITHEVYQVLFEQKPAKQAVEDLMSRALRREWDPRAEGIVNTLGSNGVRLTTDFREGGQSNVNASEWL
jgi:glycerol-3-phosphate dehydrogenase (NAD(P)+)